MKILILSVISVIFLVGCSAKEFNAGVDSITGDIKNAFENSKDKSAK